MFAIHDIQEGIVEIKCHKCKTKFTLTVKKEPKDYIEVIKKGKNFKE